MACCKRRAVPLLHSFFRPRWTIVYLFCLCLPEPAPNIRGQSKSHTAHHIPKRSSPWLPQASLLPGRPACTHCNSLHFEVVGQIFPKRVADRSQHIPHASVGSSCMQSLSCCPTACANLRSACAFHITAKQKKLLTCPARLSPCAHPVVMEASSSNRDRSNACQLRPRTMMMGIWARGRVGGMPQ